MVQIHKIAETLKNRHITHRRVYPYQQRGYISSDYIYILYWLYSNITYWLYSNIIYIYRKLYIVTKREQEIESMYGIEWKALKLI